MSFDHIRRGFDLTDDDIAAAVESREDTRGLLEHLANVSAPNTGCPKVLLVFAHLASAEADWIDGELRVERVAGGDVTVFEVMTDLGGGMRERLMPPVVMKVPIDEFRRSVERLPQLIEPLVARREQWGRLILTTAAPESVCRGSSPPSAVAISEASLCDAARPSSPSGVTSAPPAARLMRAALPASATPGAAHGSVRAPESAPPLLRGLEGLMPLRGLEGVSALRGLEGLDVVPDPAEGAAPLVDLEVGRASEPPVVGEAHFGGVEFSSEEIARAGPSSSPSLELLDTSSEPLLEIADTSVLGGTVDGLETGDAIALALASAPPPRWPAPPAPLDLSMSLSGLEMPTAEEPQHAPTHRGMPVATAVRLPTDPPQAFRGYHAPSPSKPVPGEARRQTKEGIPAVKPLKPAWIHRVQTERGIPAPGSLGPPSRSPSQIDVSELGAPSEPVPAPWSRPQEEQVFELEELPASQQSPPVPVAPPPRWGAAVPARAPRHWAASPPDADDAPPLPLVEGPKPHWGAATPGRAPGSGGRPKAPDPDPEREATTRRGHDAESETFGLPLIGAALPRVTARPTPPPSSADPWTDEAPTRPGIVKWSADEDDDGEFSLPVVDGRSGGARTVPAAAAPSEPEFPGLPLVAPEPAASPHDDDAPPIPGVVGRRVAPLPTAARVLPDLGPRRPQFKPISAPGDAVRQSNDLFDDQEPELEVDWGAQGPPAQKRRP